MERHRLAEGQERGRVDLLRLTVVGGAQRQLEQAKRRGPEEASDHLGRTALDRRDNLLQPAAVERQARVRAGDQRAARVADGVVAARGDVVAAID